MSAKERRDGASRAEYECQVRLADQGGWRWDVFYRDRALYGGWARSYRKARRAAERACRGHKATLERRAAPPERWTPDL